MRKKINITLRVILFALISLTACEQYDWEPPKWDYDANENPVRPRPIVYDDHVAPLFEKYDCTSCHEQTPPVLTTAESYNALTNGDYFNGTDIENSILVSQAKDAGHGASFNTKDLFILLDWIYEETDK